MLNRAKPPKDNMLTRETLPLLWAGLFTKEDKQHIN